MRVYIWGTGNVTIQYLNMKELDESTILGFIESHRTRETIYAKKVYEPQEIKDKDFDYILVCVYRNSQSIYQTALENGLPPEKLVFIDNWEWFNGEMVTVGYPQFICNTVNSYGNLEKVKELFPVLYQNFIFAYDMQARRYRIVQTNGYNWTNRDSVLENDNFNTKEYWTDYFRFRSFELVVNEIVRYNVEGSVAELGVFRGKFSKLINMKFSNKKFYLFDTFDSFDLNEFQREFGDGRCPESFYSIFKNTSEQLVLDIMPYPHKCIIRKGLFPKTLAGLENEKYAFVSIDVDLKESILAGLQYFYPRLNKGGYIFLHDYNNYFLDGVKEAVRIYENEIGMRLMKVPYADEGGTLVICK